MTKFIKSLGLHVDVYICCSPLGYNKRRSWEKKKKKRDLYLSGNFENVCREMASNTNKWPSPGGCWVSSWVWIQQLVTIFCWLPGCPWALHVETCHYFCHVLGTSGASVPVRAWTKWTREQIAHFCHRNPGAPCCFLWGTLSSHLPAEDA